MKPKIVLILAITFIFLLFSGCTNDNSTDNSSNDNSNNSNNDTTNSSWLIDYKPVHSIGSEINDFWINFPSINPNSGQSVDHLSWINDSIDSNVVLFVVHTTGCTTCKPQADRVINLSEKYEEYLVFLDLDTKIGGSVEERTREAYFYDPDGSPGIIALTGVFTLVNNSGNIEIGWHSWEQDVDYSELESWIRDAIYYYNVNSKD
jgi:ABC-type Fe3+-hydroxamate transport system substrate-binding protein